MIEELISNVNWIAVIIGAIAAFGLGGLWYSPKMFGKKWAEGVGLADTANKMPTHAMVAQGIGTFLLAWLIGITATTDSIFMAILIAITIAILIEANGYWSGKTKYAVMTEAGFIIVMVVVMIIAHAIF